MPCLGAQADARMTNMEILNNAAQRGRGALSAENRNTGREKRWIGVYSVSNAEEYAHRENTDHSAAVSVCTVQRYRRKTTLQSSLYAGRMLRGQREVEIYTAPL